MSIRKRMSLGGIIGKTNGDAERGNDQAPAAAPAISRRSSISSPMSWVGSGGKKINWATGMVQRSLAAAAEAVDKATKDLFVDFEEQDSSGDAYGVLRAQRGQSQRAEFEAR